MADRDEEEPLTPPAGDSGETSRQELARDVAERYDFEDFGPRQMDEMTAEEWEAAFDPDTWITGEDLLDRVEADLRRRITIREVFAVLERERHEGEPTLTAYSDEGYAIVYPDGTVEGRGTVLRDVKPTVALASMESYEVPDTLTDASLPSPDRVTEGSGQLGNLVLQVLGAVQVLAGLGLFVAWIVADLSVVAVAAAVAFLGFGAFLLVVVANARLADRFRAEEYRDRLRQAGVESGERPAFVPEPDPRSGSDEADPERVRAEDAENDPGR